MPSGVYSRPAPRALHAFTVRFEQPLYDKIKARAVKNKRSIAAQMELDMERTYRNVR